VNNRANIRDIDIPSHLRDALGRFSDELFHVVPNIKKELEEIRCEFADRERVCEKDVENAREELDQAREALRDCENQGYTDDEGDYQEPDCSGESQQLDDARSFLRESEEKLDIAKKWRHRIEVETSLFQNDICRLIRLASEGMGSAQEFLARRLENLTRYTDPGLRHASLPVSGNNATLGEGSSLIVAKYQQALSTAASFSPSLHGTVHTYRQLYLKSFPDVERKLWIHHAVEQSALTRYPGVVTNQEMHSLFNLRGIPEEINQELHLSVIKGLWDEFYESHPKATKGQLLEQATAIDDLFGSLFEPPIRL
jgi:hypothetical protein